MCIHVLLGPICIKWVYLILEGLCLNHMNDMNSSHRDRELYFHKPCGMAQIAVQCSLTSAKCTFGDFMARLGQRVGSERLHSHTL